jgi:predicted RecB family endonuclease
MGFLNIILLIIKYGPAVFELVKKAIELIRWLRDNDEEAQLAEAEVSVTEMAKRCKKAKDNTELKTFVGNLEARKEQVLTKKKEAEAALKGL